MRTWNDVDNELNSASTGNDADGTPFWQPCDVAIWRADASPEASRTGLSTDVLRSGEWFAESLLLFPQISTHTGRSVVTNWYSRFLDNYDHLSNVMMAGEQEFLLRIAKDEDGDAGNLDTVLALGPEVRRLGLFTLALEVGLE